MTAASTELDTLARRTELLFTQDVRGRLLQVRETDGEVAPRFYLARSALGNVWRFRADLPREIVVKLARLAGKERPLPPIDCVLAPGAQCPPPERVEAFREALRGHAEIRQEHRGPAFRFPAVLPDAHELATDGELVRLDAGRKADRALLMNSTGGSDSIDLSQLATPSEWLPQTDCFAIVRGDEVVSACWTSRFLFGVGAEAGVRTRESERRCGFALRVVSAWARAMRDSGTEPLYSTEWTNAASRGVARRLGLILCGEDLHFG